jgi:hypothetical protein
VPFCQARGCHVRCQRSFVSAASLLLCLGLMSPAQQTPAPTATSQPTIRVQSSLVLVDVISQDPKNGLPVRDFQQSDFRVFDNRNEVPISTFDFGAHLDTRPIAIWLTVICNEQNKDGGSANYAGNESLFQPALDQLEKNDTVAVAHWCDNGETQLDVLPTTDRALPLRALADTIKPIPFIAGPRADPAGELAFRKMVRLIIQDAHRRNPQPLPVIVFLDGDHTGQPRADLDELVNDFLETSGIVFGIKDSRYSTMFPLIGEQAQILHYMARHTGGQFFAVPPSGYATALEAIFTQLRFRYQLGFAPPTIDGRRHQLKVELTNEARARHKGVRLRFRPEYIPVPETPEWAR